jgi:hypothetical protein
MIKVAGEQRRRKGAKKTLVEFKSFFFNRHKIESQFMGLNSPEILNCFRVPF